MLVANIPEFSVFAPNLNPLTRSNIQNIGY